MTRLVAVCSIKNENPPDATIVIMMNSGEAEGALRELQEHAAYEWPESNSRMINGVFSMQFHIADLEFHFGEKCMILHATVENNTTYGVCVMFKFTNIQDVMRIHNSASTRLEHNFMIKMLHVPVPSDPNMMGQYIRTLHTCWFPCHIDDGRLSIWSPLEKMDEMKFLLSAIRITARTTRDMLFPDEPHFMGSRATRVLFPA